VLSGLHGIGSLIILPINGAQVSTTHSLGKASAYKAPFLGFIAAYLMATKAPVATWMTVGLKYLLVSYPRMLPVQCVQFFYSPVIGFLFKISKAPTLSSPLISDVVGSSTLNFLHDCNSENGILSKQALVYGQSL